MIISICDPLVKSPERGRKSGYFGGEEMMAQPAQLLYTLDELAETSRWALQEIFSDPGYQAALIVEGYGWQLSCWHWQEQDTRTPHS